MAERKPRTPKTSAELKQQLEKARAALADLEKRAYAEELGEQIRSTSIVSDFKAIQARVTDIDAVAILAAIGHAVGIRRLTVTQGPAPKRPAKPRKNKEVAA